MLLPAHIWSLVGVSLRPVETDPDFREALTRLPFAPLGPPNWRTCRRAIGEHAYGPDVGFALLGLSHGLGTPDDAAQGLSVSVSAQPPPSSVDRAMGYALQRMTTLNPNAKLIEQRKQAWDVRGREIVFRVVMLSDGQFNAIAVTGEQSVSLGGRDWPMDGFRLVEVDPLMYLSATAWDG